MTGQGLRIGSLFSGAGMLDLAVAEVFGGEVVWFCENDTAACTLLATHFPNIPNLGDIKAVDWTAVEPVDILCGGFPCTDVSCAGRREGIATHTRSGLWAYMADVIAALRPSVVIVENVKGLLSARAYRDGEVHGPDRDLESEPAGLGDRPDGPLLRAVGAVLGDLSDLFYDAVGKTVSAASVGAPHLRERIFILATPGDARDRAADRQWARAQPGQGSPETVAFPRGAALGWGDDLIERLLPTPIVRDHKGANMDKVSEANATKSRGEGGASSLADVACLLPTPVTTDAKGARNATRGDHPAHQGTTLSDAIYTGDLLPTPTARLGDPKGRGASHPDRRKELCARRGGELDEIATHILPTPNARDYKGEGNWPGRSPRPDNGRIRTAGDNLLPDVVLRELGGEDVSDVDERGQILLPTPCSADYFGAGNGSREGTENLATAALAADPWGKYGAAIRRWESIVGPAPSPTEPNSKGNPRLNPAFSSWMMGWPAGWVTDLPISRPDKLRIVGNGCVPLQVRSALRQLLAVLR